VRPVTVWGIWHQLRSFSQRFGVRGGSGARYTSVVPHYSGRSAALS
jgi:hypothetical protein